MGSNLILDLYSGVMDLIYPPHCAICREAGESYLCPKCLEKITLITPPVCRKCGTPCEAYICEQCREREYYFECARSAGIFDGVLRDAIHQLKYRNHMVLADPLGDILANCFPDTGFIKTVDIIVPVPIHITRMLDRGFNQSEEIARRLAMRIGIPIEARALYKFRKTKHQVELPFDLRVSNVHGSFRVKRADGILGKRVLLIDDVYTTGSTLNEAARVLLDAGATAVRVYTLAKSL